MTTTSAASNNPYLECVDDGLFMGEAKQWTPRKLGYLAKYLDMVSTAMKDKPWRSLHYIDLFSGPGKVMNKRTKRVMLGSPLIAYTLNTPMDLYFFADNDSHNIDVLKKRCESSDRGSRVRYFEDDCNQAVKEIVKTIGSIDHYIPGVWSSFNLAFLDPYAFELQWETIALLGSVRRMDLIIFYPQMALERAMKKLYNSPTESKIDLFFGSTKWRDIYQRYQSREISFKHRALMDFYEENLRCLKYVEIKGKEPLIRNTDRNAPLYRLIFASKHKLAEKFWEETTKKDEAGQQSLF